MNFATVTRTESVLTRFKVAFEADVESILANPAQFPVTVTDLKNGSVVVHFLVEPNQKTQQPFKRPALIKAFEDEVKLPQLAAMKIGISEHPAKYKLGPVQIVNAVPYVPKENAGCSSIPWHECTWQLWGVVGFVLLFALFIVGGVIGHRNHKGSAGTPFNLSQSTKPRPAGHPKSKQLDETQSKSTGASGGNSQSMETLNPLYKNAIKAALHTRFDEGIDPGTGRTYYVDKRSKTTSWTKPEAMIAAEQEVIESLGIQASTGSGGGGGGQRPEPLPHPWRQSKAPNGRPYFVNIETKETTWNHPRHSTAQRRHEGLSMMQGMVRGMGAFGGEQGQGQSRHKSRHKTNAPAAAQWMERKDPRTGKVYYANWLTKQTTWSKPEGVEVKELGDVADL